MSFKTTIWHSIQTDSLNSCNVSMKIFKENVLYSSIGETLCFSMIMQGHFQQDSYREKILDLGWSVLPHTPYSAHLASSDFHLFHSLKKKMHWMIKKFSQEDRWKHKWKTCWAWNLLNFTKEESMNYPIQK